MSLLRFRLQVIAVHFLPAVLGVIILTPQNDSITPYNSDEIFTYDCEIDSNQELWWTIDNPIGNLNVQLQRNDNKQLYADRYGIMVEDQLPLLNKTRLNFNVTRFSQSNFRRDHGSTVVIQCRTFKSGSFPNQSIFVYGPLDAPSNLEFSAFSETHLKLSWTRTRVPRDVQVINYVQVTNLSSGFMQEFNTTEEFIIFDETGHCSEFNLTVMSSNKQVGDSGVGFTLQNIPISPDVSPVLQSLATRVELEDTISITIMFRPANVCSTDFPVENYTVILGNNKLLPILNFGQEQIVTVINDTVISGLSMDQSFSYFIEACSNVTCRTTGTSTAYSTGIQTPTVYFIKNSTHVLVTCDFASGSRASGCLFNFTITGGVVDSELYNFSRDSKENSSLCAGGSQACMCISTERFVMSYATIEAYTLEEDGVARSSISVPTIRRELSTYLERISVCNPTSSDIGSLDGDENNIGAIVGGTLGGLIVIILSVVVIVALIVLCVKVRGNRRKQRKREQKESASENRIIKRFGSIPAYDGENIHLMPRNDNTVEIDQETRKPVIKLSAIVESVNPDGTFEIKLKYDDNCKKCLTEECARQLYTNTEVM